ncbi:MAG: hypothetical protein HY925_15890 [Elusimicrobia bacterium]|nr:hypothetical protein [Elusimicrobiota bacterium]
MTGLLLRLLLSFAGAQEFDYAGFAPSFSFDYIGVGTMDRHFRVPGETRCRALVAAGATSCSSSFSTSGAFGGRVGLMYRTPRFTIGPSVGAYYGGPTAEHTKVTIAPLGTVEHKVRNTTFRFLIEDATRFDLGEGRAVLLGAGGGLALVHEHGTCLATGTLAGGCGPDKISGRGFATWEVGPSVLLGPVELAFRWIGFARHHLVPWNSFGFTFGFRL